MHARKTRPILRLLVTGLGLAALAMGAACAQQGSTSKVHNLSEEAQLDSLLLSKFSATYARGDGKNIEFAKRLEGAEAYVRPLGDRTFTVTVSVLLRHEQDANEAQLVKAEGQVDHGHLVTLATDGSEDHELAQKYFVQVQCVRIACDEILTRVVEKKVESAPNVENRSGKGELAAWEQSLGNYAQMAIIFIRQEVQGKAVFSGVSRARSHDRSSTPLPVMTPPAVKSIDYNKPLVVKWSGNTDEKAFGSGTRDPLRKALRDRIRRKSRINRRERTEQEIPAETTPSPMQSLPAAPGETVDSLTTTGGQVE